MSSATDFAQLCRLCLVKEQVNVDIFEEPDNIRQIFHKISTCLPVKLSKEDKLPKRICEGCLYKLNIAYQFWNTSVNAEKQLLQWLKQSTRKSEADFPEKVKEEIDVPGNEIENIEDFLETSLTDVNTGKSETCVENVPESSDDEPLAKRRRRLRAQTRAAPPKPAEVIVGKVELNETDGDDNSDDPDDPNYLPDGVDMSDDNEQPGPSGLGTSTSDIPCDDESDLDDENTTGYECELCSEFFTSKKQLVNHHFKDGVSGLICCVCGEVFASGDLLLRHRHDDDDRRILVEITPDLELRECSEDVQAVLNIPNDDDACVESRTNDLLYVVDDNQCVNEVVIEDNNVEVDPPRHQADCLTSVIGDHGYIVGPSLKSKSLNILRGNLSPRKSFSKPRQSNPKRKHEIPNFTSPDYVVLSPNDEIDVVHHKCLRCEQIFINKLVYLRHIEKGKCFVNSCDVCPGTFEKNSDFYDHYVSEHKDRAICNFCFRTFMYEKNVKEHRLRHLDQFRIRCDICNKGFYTVREFRNHYRNKHTRIRHECNECGRSFADDYYFKKHISSHLINNSIKVENSSV